MAFRAAEGVGKKVLIILDNKVIGKGLSGIGYGDEWVGIRFEEGQIQEMVKDLEIVKIMGLKHSYFRYMPTMGFFHSVNCVEDEEKAQEILGKTMIVDEFNFNWGICPEWFKEVEGFGSAREAAKQDPIAEAE